MNVWNNAQAHLLKNLAKRVLAIVMVPIMLFTMTPSAFAESLSGDDSVRSLTVIDANGNIPDFADGTWSLTNGTYTVSGVAQNHEGLRVAGDVTLNLNDATIDHSTIGPPTKNTTAEEIAKYAPAISVETGNVQINLAGTNTTAGAPGYAGIYVAKDATLTIAGDGKLNATGGNACPDINFYASSIGKFLNGVPLPSAFGVGEDQRGYYAAGAGIGGNGIWAKLSNPSNPNMCERIPSSSSNFGTARINNGDINAAGGNGLDKMQFCAGAGIGAGGGTGINTPESTWSLNNPFSGTVEINGGTIVAMGGISTNYFKTGGGAGIGTGGLSGNRYYCNNDVEIIINDGRVTAIGKSNGAGIGGGENVPSGIITITGGFVTAHGGDCRSDSPANGGAGIGGGDGDWNYVWFIDISGGTVTATGAGDATGIGIGYGGWYYGDIYLRGSADVTAYGGYGRDGGNGISANTVHLWDQANVRAYASGTARGIVYQDGLDTAGITSLWVQTEDPSKPAISSLNGIAYSSPSTYLVTNWDHQTGSASSAIAYGWLTLPSDNLEGDKQFEFAWTDDGLAIDGNLVPLSAGAKPTGGSWAALYREPHFVPVSYEYVGGDYPNEIAATLPDPVEIESGTKFTAEKPAAVEGWTFDGWYTDDACTSAFEDDTALDTNTVLYGKWVQEPTPIEPDGPIGPVDPVDPDVPIGPVDPVNPTVATYKTEYYQEQLDGSYVLVETDYPLYGEVGTTVEAAIKDYAHYRVNNKLSVLSGKVVPPTAENGELKILALKVYYDLVIARPQIICRRVAPEQKSESLGQSPQGKLTQTDDAGFSRLLGLIFAFFGSVFTLAFAAYRKRKSKHESS